jgi:uncharacterized protein involved in exopolysaccharide biosynthesis
MVGALITLLHDEARRIWCYRWLVVATTALLFAAAAAYVLRMPNVYDAWGQIYVNRQTPLATAAEGVSLVGENYGSPYVVQKTLLNDDNLEAVVRRIEPPAALKTKAQVAAAVARLRGRISGTPDGGDGFLELHYTDSDPVRAQKVVSLLLNQFIAKNLDRAQTDLGRAGQFIDEQIASYGTMLLASQDKIAAFRRSHPEVSAVTLPATEEYIDGPQFAPVAPAASQAVRTSAARERAAQLEARLATLRMTYTEQYPDVVATRRQLADAIAERDLEESLAATAAALAPPTAVAAPAQTSYGPRRRIRGPIAPPPLAPEVATAWADLQRTDEVLRINYQQLIAKRAATKMSQAVYGGDGAGKYQITREPTVPTVPAGPNRKLYLAMAALLAICGGLAVGYLRAAMKGILVSTHELEKAFQLPVIGTVSWEPAWHTRRLPHGSAGARGAPRHVRAS